MQNPQDILAELFNDFAPLTGRKWTRHEGMVHIARAQDKLYEAIFGNQQAKASKATDLLITTGFFLCAIVENKPDRWPGLILKEYERAGFLYAEFASDADGFGVIAEEIDELWDDIKSNGPTNNLMVEAVQIAAMALRFITDLC